MADQGAELCRRHGLPDTTVHRWKRKDGGRQVDEARRLQALAEENRQLKRIVADQALNLQVVTGLLGTPWGPPRTGGRRSPAR